jgi:hypothetical protein
MQYENTQSLCRRHHDAQVSREIRQSSQVNKRISLKPITPRLSEPCHCDHENYLNLRSLTRGVGSRSRRAAIVME